LASIAAPRSLPIRNQLRSTYSGRGIKSILCTNGSAQAVAKIVTVDAVIALAKPVLHTGPAKANLAGNLDAELIA
jgi:hypothetical protein